MAERPGQLEVSRRGRYVRLATTGKTFVAELSIAAAIQGVTPMAFAFFWKRHKDRWMLFKGMLAPTGDLTLHVFEELNSDGGSLTYYTRDSGWGQHIDAMQERFGPWIDELLALREQRLPDGSYTVQTTPSIPRAPRWTWLRT